jgi:hypothetical protein
MANSHLRPRSFHRWLVALSLGLAILSLPLIAGSAFAQGIDIPAILSPDVKGPPTAANLQFGHQFKADVQDKGTEIARDNVVFSLMHREKLSDKTNLTMIGTYALQNYDFSNASGNPYQWDDVHRMVLGALIGHDLNDRWRLVGGAVFRSWGEGGADYGDSISGGLIGGFNYHPNEDFSVGMIIGALTALESSVGLLPVPTLQWKFAEDWNLHVGLVSVFDPGVGVDVTWQISDTLSLGTGLTFQTRRYRLRDKNRNQGTGSSASHPNRNDDGGIGQESEVPVFAMLKWKPTPKTSLDVLAGVAFAGNIRVEDKHGGRIADDSYDPAPFVGFRGMIAF